MGQLKVQRCSACGANQLARVFCLKCRSTRLVWEDASGFGHVHTFAVVHAVFDAAFAEQVPYLAATVELLEGPRLFARLSGVAAKQVRVGMAVSAVVVGCGDGESSLLFEPIVEGAAL